MRKRLSTACLLTGMAGLLFTSCYQEIDLDKYRTTPQMVINCAATTDTAIIASITRTWFFPENTPYVKLPHADVKLYINGEFAEQMKWKEIGSSCNGVPSDSAFVSTVTPKEGDRIKITASTPEYGTATAEDRIPAKMPIEEVRYTIQSTEGMYDGNYSDYYKIFYKVTFQELPEPGNYYLVRICEYDDYYRRWTSTNLTAIDPIMDEYEDILDGALGFDGIGTWNGLLFTDSQINGQRYTLQVQESVSSLPHSARRKVAVYSLSEAYYHYLHSMQKLVGSTLEEALGNIGFAEPWRVYSNVQGGTGILGACQHTDMEITINDIPKN